MSGQGTFPGWINPLSFLEAEEIAAGRAAGPLTCDSILDFLRQPGIDTSQVLDRYKEIDGGTSRLWIAPAEPRILDKLVWPLRHAKASYLTGNYLSVVALCGMVAEMVALLRWEIAEVSINGVPMTEQDEVALFGSTFEKLGQERRQRVLRAYGLIDASLDSKFTEIRTRRRKYLHLWSQDHDQLPPDARVSFDAAVALVISILGQETRNGGVVLSDPLKKYLARTGFYRPKDET